MKRKFIINPGAGEGLASNFLQETKTYFLDHLKEFDFVLTKSREDIGIQTQKALKEGYQQIIPVGGDGTINNSINAFFENNKLINPDALLAVGKRGTGSDFFRTLTYKKETDDWKEIVLNHSITNYDLGEVTYLNATLAKKYFCNMAGHGISAYITKLKTKIPDFRPIALKYLATSIYAMASFKSQKAKITLDEEPFFVDLLGLFVSKGRYAGGGMIFGGGVEIDDGYFDTTILCKMSKLKMLKHFSKLYTIGWPLEEGIVKRKVKKVKIESEYPIDVELDGENTGTTDLEISILPRILKVCTPIK